MGWYDGLTGQFISVKEGEEKTLSIKHITKVTDKPDFDPKKKDGTGQGFHFEMDTDKGTLTIGSFSLQTALAKAEVNEGDVVTIKHTGRGKYEVSKL